VRHLLGSFDPSAWMVVSASVFFLAFVGLLVWVYLPSRRRYYEANAELPLDRGSEHD